MGKYDRKSYREIEREWLFLMPIETFQSSSSASYNLISKGKFYFIYENSDFLILEDKTKRGLEIKENLTDKKRDVIADMGIIYDLDGKGHKVGIRWYYPKQRFSIGEVMDDAKVMEKRYLEIREMTCPDDNF